ncbi:TPA: phenylacetate--CoA ligase family protein [Bacillus cereus]|uniref:phenylacetate--CoA ligase family protein n=1 Tax=Bacillus TaxID=1386 RepID=UPI003309B2EF|nr:phenylacetate--CoA ligase family protein [Bacillus cereus]HDR8493505.1 phenylacetate--CoA ligase family protein [Bacillus cereus]
MKMPETVAKYLYWKTQDLRGRNEIKQRLEWLNETQWWTPKQLQELQFEKFKQTIEHAYNTVPYYKRLFEERDITPNDISSFKDIKKLPLLTREKLLDNQNMLVSTEADYDTLQTNFSSGSTGRRAEFKQDVNFRLWMKAHQLRTYQWCNNWDLGKPFVLLWGSEIYWSFKEVIDKAENLMTNRKEFNTFNLSKDLISDFLIKLCKYKPYLVSTYTNAMYLIAKEAEKQNLQIEGLKAIQATSEPVPIAMRKDMRRIFNCEVYDKYGSRETNIISHESPNHEGNLIQVENVFVEFLNEKGEDCQPGEKGRIVVTTLNNLSMPLIRYETSDLASPLEGYCSSGLGFPRMSDVHGRIQDLILTPSGEHIDAYFFSFLFMRFKEIHWFQVVQQKIDHLLIRLYVPNGVSQSILDEITNRIHHHTGFPYNLEFEKLNKMPESPTGKFRLCISELGAYTWK